MIADRASTAARAGVRALAPAATGLVAIALTVYRTAIQLQVGPLWDSYAFLANAAAIAGKSTGYTEPWRPPLLSVLTAPAFVAMPLNTAAIQIADALLAISCLLAFYLILRRRFTQIPASLGTIALLLSPPVWAWLGVGYSDIAAVAVALWALLFALKANEGSPWWYLGALPALLGAAMTRPTALLAVLPVGAFILLRWRPFRQAKQLLAGAVLAVVAYIPFGIYYSRDFGDALFPFIVALRIASEQLTGAGFVTTEPGAFPQLLLLAVGLVSVTAASGLLYRLAIYLRRHERFKPTAILFSGSALLMALLAQTSGNLIVRQGALALAVFILFAFLGRRDDEGRIDARTALDGAALLWMLVFGDWLVHNPIQVPRYLIPVLPGAIYMLLLGISSWPRVLETLHPTERVWKRDANAFTWAAVAVFVAAAAVIVVPTVPSETDLATVAAVDTAQWLAENDSEPSMRTIYSDVWPYTSWYSHSEARPMPAFEDYRAFLHELEKSNADYFITFSTASYEPTFSPLYESGSLKVLGREKPARTDLPRVRYLGDAWDNYIEGLCDFSYFLDVDSGAQGWERSAFLDNYTAQELLEHDAVAAYGFRWRNRTEAEKVMEEYVTEGGTLIIDASGNFRISGFTIQEGALLGTAIQRETLPADAQIDVTAEFVGRHPELRDVEAAPFVDESGGAWTGAAYSPLDPVQNWNVLATVAGKPLVATQDIGSGRVYWIGYNLAWHAFSAESEDEARLVKAVFDDAIAFANGEAE